jgi:NAD(P)-dependent dehydrogenase (short-subunit alcohol dehydrogenase family)
MSNSKILTGKNAVVFGAGGTIGSAVAQEFASEGAEVLLVDPCSTGPLGTDRKPFHSGERGRTYLLGRGGDAKK